ncbi:MAG: glycosyltransferase family 2 protein [Bacteroidaceae bacterium]|nr:glycosyltransferase family 2 protein [Bacteroidaceae bacterium]
MSVKNRLAIVVPCFNEQEVLIETTKRLSEVIIKCVDAGKISDDSYILFVNDGSSDRTWEIVQEQSKVNRYVCGVNLAGNVGHQNALLAGLSVAADNCDIAISIDADLQDDVNAISKMIDKYEKGCDIVYGVRDSRATDTLFKRYTAQKFYKLMKGLGVKCIYNHADFRLMSNRAIRFLLRYEERNLFLRGMVPTIGYKTDSVTYDRSKRMAGESKYPLMKMLSFAFDGITSFSVRPIHFVLYSGVFFILIAIAIFSYVTYSFFTGNVVPGWTSLMLSLWLCSGCVLLGLGVVGEYIGKIYMEVKRRPRYNIENVLLHEQNC